MIVDGISKAVDRIWIHFEILGCFAKWVNCGESEVEKNYNRRAQGQNVDNNVLEAYIEKLKKDTILKVQKIVSIHKMYKQKKI